MPNEQTETQPAANRSTEPGEKTTAPNSATQTQDRPNLSTEHQQEGDARSPSDTLDRGQETPGGQEQERVVDRPNVGSVSPEDYPKDEPDH